MNDFIIFFEKSGLKKLILNGITNFRDYYMGVEVGLDSNGRKNRGGKIMEEIIQNLLINVYQLNINHEFTNQGTQSSIRSLWNIELPVDKSSRRPDFVVNKNGNLFWIETNFYSGGGSKLKSTCGEYRTLSDFVGLKGLLLFGSLMVRDGKLTLKPLEETFNNVDYIFNLKMVKEGILNDIWE